MLRIFADRKAHARKLLSDANKARDGLNWKEASNLYRLFLNESPGDASIWVQFGHALKESKSSKEAERAYQKAIELRPRDADAHLQIGHLYKITDRHQEALLSYQLAYALDPALTQARDELMHVRTLLETALVHRIRHEVAEVLKGAGAGRSDGAVHAALPDDLMGNFNARLGAVVSQVDHILSHVAITKALGAELARLSRQVEQQRRDAAP